MEEDQVRVLRWSVALPGHGEDDRRVSPLLLSMLPRAVGILMPFKKDPDALVRRDWFGEYPADWKEIRTRILARDGNRCKTCRAPNGAWISRDKAHGLIGAYMEADGRVTSNAGTPMGFARGSEWEGDKAVKIVLTVAHLDHDETRNSDDNLASLCQKHHLDHDRKDNISRAMKRRRAKKAAGELF